MTAEPEHSSVHAPGASRVPVKSLLILAAAGALLYAYQGLPVAALLTLSVTAVLLIIFGERFALDYWLDARGIPGREALIPLAATAIAIAMKVVHPETIPRVFAEKIDIIFFILAFAVIAEGIGRSGYFAFAAYKIVYRCQGNTTRLILYLFILASILTLFTSNDIVVLVLTPIIMSVCVHAGIHNARLLLLAQFVAANTLSMGLLIGSPTNIILGKVLHIDFFEYLGLMIVPAILSCMLSMILIDWLNLQSRPGTRGLFVKRWSYTDTYRVPAFARAAQFTPRMQRWLGLFAGAVVWLSIVSALEMSLFWSAIPTAAASYWMMYRDASEDTGNRREALRDLGRLTQFLPYGILFFGMCFFIFADELARLDLVDRVVLPYVRKAMLGDLVHASVSMIFLSGLVVNMLNDLPAAALLSDLLKQMEATSGHLNEYMRVVVIQAFLVGLNIGCYVTPIGALAGILWFNIIKKEERAQRRLLAEHGSQKVKPLEMPNRGDMVKYGLMHFCFVGLILGLLLPFFLEFVDLLLMAPQQEEKSSLLEGMISLSAWLPWAGLALLAFTFFSFRAVLRRGDVLLGHMREVFAVVTRFTIWSMKHRALYFALSGGGMLAAAAGLLYWSEIAHTELYGVPKGAKPLFDSLGSFLGWIMLCVNGGMPEALKPHSTLGLVLISIIPLAALGGIVLVAQLSTGEAAMKLSRRLAVGDIPGYRIVVVNFHARFGKFVETALHTRDAAILLLCDPAHHDQAAAFAQRLNASALGGNRVYAAAKHPDAFHNFQEFRIDQADEIYLLSDMTTQGEYEKLRYVAKLDALLNGMRASAAEGLDTGIAGAEHSGEDAPGEIDDLAGMPRIFIETPSERFHELLRRSSSPLMMRAAIRMAFDADVSAFLMADMDGGIDLMNAYYRAGTAPEQPGLFEGDASPLQKFVMKSFELDKRGKELFRAHFSGTAAAADTRRAHHARTLRHLSFTVRARVEEGTRGSRYIDGKETKDIDYTRLIGLVMQVGEGDIHIGIPSAALSMQHVLADKVILREDHDPATPLPPRIPSIGEGQKIFIFNFTPHARAFVAELLQAFDGEKKPRLIVMAPESQQVPEELAKNPLIHVLDARHAEDMVTQICPAAGSHEGTRAAKPVLKAGDRLYVFLDFDEANPESASIDFIDRLDSQLQAMAADAAAKKRKPALGHPDIYIAVETSGAESRVLFENFFVDKVIDTSLPRQNYMEVLAMIFHRAMNDHSLAGQAHGSLSHFHQAGRIAKYLCRHLVVYAEDVVLKDHLGGDIRLVGRSFAQACHDIQAYSVPPMQLVARLRLVPVAEMKGPHRHRTFRLAEVPEGEALCAGDFLVNLPMI